MPNTTSPSGIYKITNTVNGKCYIGSAVNFAARTSGHLRRLRGNIHHSGKLQNAWNKYGESAFLFELVELVPEKVGLIAAEQKWMDADLPAYNICKLAGSPLGVQHTQETRNKLSKALRGRVASEEARANMSAAQKRRTVFPKHSEETKAKISAASKGRSVSEETRKKQSDRLKRDGTKNFTPENRAKGNAARLGVKFTDERKANIRASFTEEERAKRSLRLLGVPISDERKAAMSAAQKIRRSKEVGRKLTDAQKANMSAAQSLRRATERAAQEALA